MIIDPATASRPDVYKLMIRSVIPRPIAWVSSVSRSGRTNLAPFSFFMAVSSSPPTLAFAPGRHEDGTKKDTLLNIEETRQFVVNVVTEATAERMNETATEFPRGASEFERAGLTAAASERVSAPRVSESPIHFECELYDIIPVGADEVGGAAIVIGEIVLIHVDDSILDGGKVDPARLAAIGRLGGMEYATTRDRFTMVRKQYRPEP
jgi:flavin reductase (DIM6/NTAB) family NADH-FMN oxidoreductase RutF